MNQPQTLPHDNPHSFPADRTSTTREPGPCVSRATATACRRVLVVDDHPLLRFALIDALIGQGYECYAAEDGLAALSVLATTHVDLVVSDLSMPNMGGLELLMRMGTSRTTQSIPVVVVTAHLSDDLRLRILGAGAKAVLGRSPRPDEVLAAVRALLIGPTSAPQSPLAPAL